MSTFANPKNKKRVAASKASTSSNQLALPVTSMKSVEDEELVNYEEIDESNEGIVVENSTNDQAKIAERIPAETAKEMREILDEEFEDGELDSKSSAEDLDEYRVEPISIEAFPFLDDLPHHFKLLRKMYDLIRPGGRWRETALTTRDDPAKPETARLLARDRVHTYEDQFAYLCEFIVNFEGVIRLRNQLREIPFSEFRAKAGFDEYRNAKGYEPVKLEWLATMCDPENAENRRTQPEATPGTKRARVAGSPEGGTSSSKLERGRPPS